MQPSVSFRRIAATTALVLATLAVVAVLWRLGQVVIFAVISIILAAALRTPMLSLETRVRSRSAAILLLYLLIVTIVGGGGYVFSAPLGSEIAAAAVNFPQAYTQLLATWEASTIPWQQSAAQTLPDITDVVAAIGANGTTIAYQLAGITYNLFSIVLLVIAILTLTFYWLVDEDRFVRLWLSLMPSPQRAMTRQIWFDIEWRVGVFVRSEAAQSLITITLLWLGLRLLGVPYAALWALYGGLAQFLPWIGVPLIFVPLVPLALTLPWYVTLGAGLLLLAVSWIIERGVEPWFATRGIAHPIISVLALMVLGEAAGITGMLIALPLAATIQSILTNLLQISATPRVLTPAASAIQLQALRTRLEALQERLPSDPNQRRAQAGLLARADELLDDVEQTLHRRTSEPQRRRLPQSAPLRSPAVYARNQEG